MIKLIICVLYTLLFCFCDMTFAQEEISFEAMKVSEHGKDFIVGYHGDIYGMPLFEEDGVQMTAGYDGTIKKYIRIDDNFDKAEVLFHEKRSLVNLSWYPIGTALQFYGNIRRSSEATGSGTWNNTQFVSYEYKITDVSQARIDIKHHSYLIKQGDTLWDIAERVTGNPMDFKLIASLNRIENPNRIKSGSILYLPAVNCTMVWFKDKEGKMLSHVEPFTDYYNDPCLQKKGLHSYYGRKMFIPSCVNSDQCRELGYHCKDLAQIISMCQMTPSAIKDIHQ